MIKVIKESQANCIEYAVDFLKSGKILAFATDTVYGLAVDAKNFEAVENLYKIKKRDKTKAIAILLPNLARAKEIFIFDELANKIANKFLPGALTMVLEVKEQQSFLSKNLNINGNFLGFRIISSEFIDKIFTKFDGAIALTSANLSGNQSSITAQEIYRAFEKTTLDLLIIDSKKLKSKTASTVVKVSQNNLEILREGLIPIDKIKNL